MESVVEVAHFDETLLLSKCRLHLRKAERRKTNSASQRDDIDSRRCLEESLEFYIQPGENSSLKIYQSRLSILVDGVASSPD